MSYLSSGTSVALSRWVFFLASCLSAYAAPPAESFGKAHAFLDTWCQSCHTGKAAAGGFRIADLNSPATLSSTPDKWTRAAARVRNGEMPPRGVQAPSLEERSEFTDWVDASLRAEACSSAAKPAVWPVRRLNREEYSATVRDLLNVNIDVGERLPAEGAGGEGFDNAAETLFLSPIHAEKYMEAARIALDFAATDARAKAVIFISRPGDGVTELQSARTILHKFLRRAFRRPTEESAVAPWLALFEASRKAGETFDRSILFALRGVLMSPEFLFRLEPAGLDDYALASRLSYFLWGSMPDELLWDLAEAGQLKNPEVLKSQIGRMLRHPKSTGFARRFVEQWLRTRDLGGDKSPDPAIFPIWAESEEVRSDIRYQPVMFLRELLTKDLSLLNLLDSRFTVLNRTLAKLYNVPVQWRKDAARALYPVELPAGSDRGGLLGMPAVLAVSSYPNRTSPVLRGAWVLDVILGTPPPPPPPGVPPLEKEQAGNPTTVRERLTQHRANPACASCHSRIDPPGFALENYDALGFWRTEEAGKPIDSAGELSDGSKINGPNELKDALMNRKDLFIRNLTGKMLGYALGRGLTLQDSCAVEKIAAEVQSRNYSAQALIEGIVFSMPFRAPSLPVTQPADSRSGSQGR